MLLINNEPTLSNFNGLTLVSDQNQTNNKRDLGQIKPKFITHITRVVAGAPRHGGNSHVLRTQVSLLNY